MSGWSDPFASAEYDANVGYAGDRVDPGVSFSDDVENLKSAGADIVKGGAQSVRALAEQQGNEGLADSARGIAKSVGEFSDASKAAMSPSYRRALESTPLDTDFWDNIGTATRAKLVNMLPMAATIIGASVAAPTAAAATGVAAGVGGLLAGTQSVNDLYEAVDKFSDAELAEQSPQFKYLLERMPAKAARAVFNAEFRGMKPVLNAIVGAGATAIGPMGGVARGVKGGSAAIGAEGRGRLASGATAGVEGGASEAFQEGFENLSTQLPEVEFGLKPEIDQDKLVGAVLTGGWMGGITGGVAGATLKGRGSGKRAQATEDATSTDTTTDIDVASPPKESGTGTPIKPVESEAVGNPDSAPTRSGRTYPKAEAAKQAAKRLANKNKPIDEPAVNPGIVDPDQAAALAAKQAPPPKVEAPDLVPPQIAEASARLRTPETIANEPVVADAYIPPEVMDAPQRAPEQIPAPAREPISLPDTPPFRTDMQEPVASDMPKQPEVPQQVTPQQVTPQQATPQHTPPAEPAKLDQPEGPWPVQPTPVQPTPVEVKEQPVQRTGRVLRAVTEEAKAKEKEAVKATREKIKANLKAVAKEENPEVGGKNLSAEQKATIAKSVEAADNIIKAHAPADVEVGYISSPDARRAVYERAVRMVAAAQNEGVKIPTRIRVSKRGDQAADAPSVQLLRYAADLERAGKTGRGKKFEEAVARFVEREEAVRGGKADEALSARRSEGEAARRINQGDVEALSESGATANAIRGLEAQTEKAEVKTKGGSTVEIERAKAASPVRKVELTEEQKKAAIAALEAVQRRDAAKAEAKKSMFLEDSHPLMLALKVTAGNDAAPIYSTNAGQVLRTLDTNKLPGVAQRIAPFIQRRLAELIKDVEVHIVSPTDMAALYGRDLNSGKRAPLGSYVRKDGLDTDGYIMIRSDMMDNPSRLAHVMLHEGMHAAVSKYIDTNKSARENIRTLMNEAYFEAADHYDTIAYAMENEHEFISEAFSNPKVQEILGRIELDPKIARQLGLRDKKFSLWTAFIAKLREWLGMPTGSITILEAAIRAGADLMDYRKAELQKSGQFHAVGSKGWTDARVHALEEGVRGYVAKQIRQADLQEQDGAPHALKFRTMDNIAQAAEHYFGDKNPVRIVADALEKTRVTSASNLKKTEPVVSKLYELEKKYRGTDTYEKFATLVHDETMAGVFADRDLASQGHISKNADIDVWQKAQHADLKRRYDALPDDLKQARAEAMTFFTKTQNEMSLGIIKNRILKAIGVEDDGLAQRIFEGKTTDADGVLLGERTLELIKQAKELGKISGPYFPLMRRGSHVVTARYKIDAPSNARVIAPNEFEFATRREANDYAKAQDTRTDVESVYVDKDTGEKFGIEADGKQVRISKNDINAEQRWRVHVQNRHVEFFESANEAREAAVELARQGLKVDGVKERRFEVGDRQADMMSSQVQTLLNSLEARKGYREMTDLQRRELSAALNEASIRMMGSTRIQSRRLPRRYVEGASNDLTRNALEYAQSSSGYLAKLEHATELEDALKDMRKQADSSEGDQTKSLGRSSIANEIEKRVHENNGFDEGTGPWNAVTKRLLTVSFLDKLFSPAYNIINSLQPMMVAMPILAGRHGVGASTSALSRAYHDIAAHKVVAKGFRDSAAKAKDTLADTGDFLADIKARLKSDNERAMLDYLAERGSVDPDAGLELSNMIRSRDGVMGRVDAGIGYAEGIARQMPRAIEAINRTATAVAAYRLEVAKGASHQKAMRYAQETVNNSQGLYSNTNSPAIFKHPLARISLQFKKYGLNMYQILGTNVAKALQGATREERIEAVKTLTALTATHVAMAGAMGLPTEPLKYLLMGAQAAGLTKTGWGDVENKAREGAARVLGKTGGELFTKGLPRAIGIDLSSRVGLDSLSSFGEPRSSSEADVKKYLFDTIAGAPVGLVGDWVKGVNALTAGDFTKAAELMVPVKVAADSIRAYRTATEGKKSGTGRETMSPYSLGEAAVRAIGFTPAREAENSAARSAFYSQQKRQSTERSELIAKWVSAKPADKASAFAKVQSWNRGQSKDSQISMKDLTSAARRRSTEAAKGTVVNGVRTTKRDREIFDRASNTYNN